MTLKDARFALNDDGPEWSLRQSLANVWPRLIASEGRISTRAVTQRFSGPGRELRKLASGGAVRWAHMSRATVVSDARKRLRNPSTFKQYSTDLCGPFALLFEFARREPTRYVKALAELLDHGTFSTVGGHTFVAEDDLRSLPAATIPQADWLLAATIRDEENLVEDVDDGEGWEGFTWPTEIVAWIEQILGLRGTLYNVYHTEEMEAIRAAQRAIDAGGVAVVLIDPDMIHDGGTTHRESPIWWRRRKLPGQRVRDGARASTRRMTTMPSPVTTSCCLAGSEARTKTKVWISRCGRGLSASSTRSPAAPKGRPSISTGS